MKNKELIKVGDSFTYFHPKYPNAFKDKIMIAEFICDKFIEKKDTEGELIVRKFPIKYCTKVVTK